MTLAEVTVTSTVPVPAGEVAIQVVLDEQLTDVPGVAPNCTVVEPGTKPVPVMVTTVPPPTAPELGEMALTPSGRLTVWVARAEGPPLFETLCPVKVWVVEVPAASVTVKVAVKGPAVE